RFVRSGTKSGESAAAAKWIVARGAAGATSSNGADCADWVARCAAREVGASAATSVTRAGRAEYGNCVRDYGCFLRTIRGSQGVVHCIFDSCRSLAAWRDFPARARRPDFHGWRNYLCCRGADNAEQAGRIEIHGSAYFFIGSPNVIQKRLQSRETNSHIP